MLKKQGSYLLWRGCIVTSHCWPVSARKRPQTPSADRRSYIPLLDWCCLHRGKCFYTSYMPSNTDSMYKNVPTEEKKTEECVQHITEKRFYRVCILFSFCVSHHFFVKKEPRQELGQSRRVILLLRTAHKHSWPPGNTKIIHEAAGCMPTKTSFKDDFMFIVTFMSVSLGMWSLKSSTELTKKGMWQDNTYRHHDRKKKMYLLLLLLKNQSASRSSKTSLPF